MRLFVLYGNCHYTLYDESCVNPEDLRRPQEKYQLKMFAAVFPLQLPSIPLYVCGLGHLQRRRSPEEATPHQSYGLSEPTVRLSQLRPQPHVRNHLDRKQPRYPLVLPWGGLIDSASEEDVEPN